MNVAINGSSHVKYTGLNVDINFVARGTQFTL